MNNASKNQSLDRDWWLCRLQEEIDHVCQRPLMFVTEDSLSQISAYLNGFAAAIAVEQPWAAKHWHCFQQWIEGLFGIRHPGWHWTRILLHIGDEREAKVLIPNEFRNLVASGLLENPHEWADERVREKRGMALFAPGEDLG